MRTAYDLIVFLLDGLFYWHGRGLEARGDYAVGLAAELADLVDDLGRQRYGDVCHQISRLLTESSTASLSS